MLSIQLPPNKKVYFASDFHLGSPSKEASLARERKIVRWLDQIAPDAGHIFLMGDLFDFWYEYNKVIPKGFLRFQGKLAELVERGIPITIFTGNHDMWMFGYFTEELGIPVYRKPQELTINNLRLHIAHGDGLGPGDHLYKVLKWCFENRLFRLLFSRLHPDLALAFGQGWSGAKKRNRSIVEPPFTTPEREYLWVYATEQEQRQHRDCYIFGHRHLPLDLQIGANSRYINLGEWFHSCTFAVCDGQNIQLLAYNE